MNGNACSILIIAHFTDAWEECLHHLSPNLKIVRWPVRDGDIVPDHIWQDAEVIYTFSHYLPRPEQGPHVRWVQLYSAGADGVLGQPLFATDVSFTTTSGIHAIPIAEYVLGVTLAWFHRFPTLFRWQQERYWPTHAGNVLAAEEVYGKTIGIVGYGSIGRQVARVARGVGMRVLAMQRGSDHRDPGFTLPGEGDPEGTLPERYYPPEDLPTLLHESDVVVIAVPLTPQTRNMFNEAAFKAMKPSAFLINIARGGVCDEATLLQALHEKWLAGAALDVFQHEPLPHEHPFWQMPNVILSPHVTGMHPDYSTRAARLFEENLRRYLAHQPLLNLVDKKRGY